MPTIPLIAITRPNYLSPEVLEDIGLDVESMSGYSVFPQQLVVGIKVPGGAAIRSADTEEVRKYILSTIFRTENRRCEVLGDPRYMNDMLCFWLMDTDLTKKLRHQYPRFMINEWTACFKTQ